MKFYMLNNRNIFFILSIITFFNLLIFLQTLQLHSTITNLNNDIIDHLISNIPDDTPTAPKYSVSTLSLIIVGSIGTVIIMACLSMLASK